MRVRIMKTYEVIQGRSQSGLEPEAQKWGKLLIEFLVWPLSLSIISNQLGLVGMRTLLLTEKGTHDEVLHQSS